MLIALGVGFLLGNVFLKNLVMRPRPFVTHTDLTALLRSGGPVVVSVRARSARLRQLRRCTSSTIRPVSGLSAGGSHCVYTAVCQRPLPGPTY